MPTRQTAQVRRRSSTTSSQLKSALTLPAFFLAHDVLDALIEELREKEAFRRRLAGPASGKRVSDPEQARRLFKKVNEATHEVLSYEGRPKDDPQLTLTSKIKKLPWQTFKLYLFLVPVGGALVALNLQGIKDLTTAGITGLASAILLFMPLVIHRRARLNIEHECSYTRKSDGSAVITMDQLRAKPFQSYLAHEYAHHLYFELFDHEGPDWAREGWARLMQWKIMQRLCEKEDDEGYLREVLDQIVGELKFACEMSAMALVRRLPPDVRRVRSMYHRDPIVRFFTGTPGFDPLHLITHAKGTAAYFAAARRPELKERLHSEVPVTGQFELFQGAA